MCDRYPPGRTAQQIGELAHSSGVMLHELTAIPGRLPALYAKAIIISVSTFIVSLVALVAAALLAAAVLPASGVTPHLSDAGAWWAILGGATYLALLSVLALAIGTVVRNSAGGIATVLALILVLHGVLNIVAAVARVDWAHDLAAFLPDAAGGRMYSYASDGAQAATGGRRPAARSYSSRCRDCWSWSLGWSRSSHWPA